MVRVEGGTIQMERNNDSNNEKPVHRVTVKGFYMSDHEITQKEWAVHRQYMKDTDICRPP
jgi:formylglycine-generating enzyme required for sulfatase activity